MKVTSSETNADILNSLVFKVDGDEKLHHFVWQPYENTFLSYSSSGGGPIKLQFPKEFREKISLFPKSTNSEIPVSSKGKDDSSDLTVPTRNGVISLQGSLKSFGFRLSCDMPAKVSFFWLSSRQSLLCTKEWSTVHFGVKDHQGWGLVPLSSAPLSVTLVNGSSKDVRLETAVVYLDTPHEQSLEPLLRAHTSLTLTFPNALRTTDFWVRPSMIVCGCFLVILGIILISGKYLQRWSKFHLPRNDNSQSISQLVVNITFIGIFIFHSAYALSIGARVTGDSLGYYRWASLILQGASWSEFSLALGEKGPVYSAFLATLFSGAGESLHSIALVQHWCLASLFWICWIFLPNSVSGVHRLAASIFVALSPLLSVTAQLVWTETLFACCSFATLLIFCHACERRRFSLALLSGVLWGISFLIRPNGILIGSGILIVVTIKCLRRQSRKEELTLLGLLMAGFLLTVIPWSIVALNNGSSLIGSGYKNYNAWQAFLAERRLSSDLDMNLPDRWLFVSPASYGDNYATFMDEFPSVFSLGLEHNYPKMSPYFLEVVKEAEQKSPSVWRGYAATLWYHLTFIPLNTELRNFTDEINQHLNFFQHLQKGCNVAKNNTALETLTNPSISDAEKHQALECLSSETEPKDTTKRLRFINFSLWFVPLWGLLILLTLLGIPIMIDAPLFQASVAYCVTTILAYSTNLMPMQRYVVILEPFIILGAVLSTGYFGHRWTSCVKSLTDSLVKKVVKSGA
jgi:Dolichyl-phosphate-mannose-protein mannosyltransferase